MIQLSVIIPVYNSEQTIVQCLDSVVSDLETTPYIWEIVLIDDGSKDNSANIIQNYINQSSHWGSIHLIQQPNGGAASARNTGIKASTGTYIAFNDSDDIWIQGKTTSQMEYLLNNPHIDMICGAHEVPYRPLFKKFDEYTHISIGDLILQNFCSPQTAILKRGILQRSGLFDENMRLGAEENSLFHGIAYHGNIILQNRVVSRSITKKLRWGESGLSGNIVRMERGELYSFRQTYKKHYISLFQYICSSTFSILKFIRRYLLKTTCFLRKNQSKNNA